MGYGLEVEMIRLARERDLLTAPYVFTVEEARAMAAAGADVLVPHMGLTTGGSIGARTAMSLEEAIARCRSCTMPPRPSRRRSSACATADRSPSPTMPSG